MSGAAESKEEGDMMKPTLVVLAAGMAVIRSQAAFTLCLSPARERLRLRLEMAMGRIS